MSEPSRLPPWGAPASSWPPLLDGPAADRAWDAIRAIAEALASPGGAGPQEPADLANGHAGHALFFAYLARATGAQADADRAVAHLRAAIAGLAEQSLGPGLCGGFAGVGWVHEHLARSLLPAGTLDDDDTEEVDAALAGLLEKRTFQVYDLFDGLAGIAVYALEGLPRPGARRCLELVVARLEELAERRAPGLTWMTPPELLPDHQRDLAPAGYYNLGVAHGVPGVLPVLAASAAAGVEAERACALLEPAVAWLLDQEQGPEHPARFPNWNWPGSPPETSRLAWCYGDAGVAAALLLAARLAGRADWESAARRLALEAAARPPERSGVQDAALCHGAAGLAHVFHRLYRATGERALEAAARDWFERVLALRERGTGIAGFSAWKPGFGGWTAEPGFLTGAAGIGLALLAAVSSGAPDWDRVLLTAVPPLPSPSPTRGTTA